VAETFTFAYESGVSLSDIARRDTLVTVVDARNFFDDYCSRDELCDRGVGFDANDAHDVVQLLVDQVEFANVIVINKTDLVEADDVSYLEAVLRKLNPAARIVRAARGLVPLELLLDTGLFNMEHAARVLLLSGCRARRFRVLTVRQGGNRAVVDPCASGAAWIEDRIVMVATWPASCMLSVPKGTVGSSRQRPP
jgi:G3E family GTPase